MNISECELWVQLISFNTKLNEFCLFCLHVIHIFLGIRSISVISLDLGKNVLYSLRYKHWANFFVTLERKITQINRLICYLPIPNKSHALNKLISLEAMVFNQNDIFASPSNMIQTLACCCCCSKSVFLSTHAHTIASKMFAYAYHV